mmetsp:Transcript_90063/g.257530  ORF Transcript_90063/g.257530 Transcript_90063/m.257530 type:complete len:257 (+) Transcript_90063:218-988(+)
MRAAPSRSSINCSGNFMRVDSSGAFSTDWSPSYTTEVSALVYNESTLLRTASRSDAKNATTSVAVGLATAASSVALPLPPAATGSDQALSLGFWLGLDDESNGSPNGSSTTKEPFPLPSSSNGSSTATPPAELESGGSCSCADTRESKTPSTTLTSFRSLLAFCFLTHTAISFSLITLSLVSRSCATLCMPISSYSATDSSSSLCASKSVVARSFTRSMTAPISDTAKMSAGRVVADGGPGRWCEVVMVRSGDGGQ